MGNTERDGGDEDIYNMKDCESKQEVAAQASDIFSTSENAIRRDEERMDRVGDADHEAEVESALKDEGVPSVYVGHGSK